MRLSRATLDLGPVPVSSAAHQDVEGGMFGGRKRSRPDYRICALVMQGEKSPAVVTPLSVTLLPALSGASVSDLQKRRSQR